MDQTTAEQSARASEAAAQAEQERRQSAAEGVDERLAARDRSVAEFYEREEGIKPTPSQRENDLAKVGAQDIDEKEPDGSEPEEVFHARVLHGRVPGPHPYETRDLGNDTLPAASRRGPGRPRKSEQQPPTE